MASIIRIKRSTTAGDPSVLGAGELAYSAADYTNVAGGGRLYIGIGTESGGGDAASHLIIGGKYFTDKLDHTPGTLTASSALIVDADKKLDELLVDDLSLNGNTVSATGANNLKLQAGSSNLIQLATSNYIAGGSQDGAQVHLTNTTAELKQLRTGQVRLVVGDGGTESYAASLNNNGSFTVPGTINTLNDANLVLNPNGTGKVSIEGVYTLPSSDGSPGYVLTTDGMGSVTFQSTSGALNIAGDTGSGTITLLSETFGVLGGTGISTDSFGNDITVTLENTAVSAGTYGSSTKSASFTVDAQGRLTAASETDLVTTLNFDGNTGSGSIDLLSETLSIAGEGAISTNVLGNTLYVNVATATDTINGVANFNATDFDVSIGGTVSINIVSLENQTTGNYVRTIADSGNNNITVNNSGTAIADVTLDLTDTAVTPGTYGDASNIPQITIDSKGRVTSASNVSVATTLNIAGDTGSDAVSLITDTLQLTGGEGIDIAVTDNTITVTAEDASDTNKGIASFNTASFTVTSGDVTIKNGGITNDQLEHDYVTIGDVTVTLGDLPTTTITGLTSITSGNLTVSASEIESTAGISLAPAVGNHVSVNSTRIMDLADPEQDTDAVNKRYVDGVAAGLTWKQAVNLLADSNIALTGNTGTLVIDSHSALTSSNDGYRLLLTGQTTSSQNGIYVYNEAAGVYTLTRTTDADAFGELNGAAVFVIEGTAYGTTGWTQTNHYLSNFSNQTWIQFSGTNQYQAGDGLDLTGTEFSVNVGPGLEISSDDVQLASTVAGDGLTFDTGVLNVVGTADRISVSANAVDISATYVGQNTITTLGTITTGVWNGTPIDLAYGGTGFTSYAYGDLLVGSVTGTLTKLTVGTAGKVLQSNGSTIVYGDVDGGTY
jgi:hypothetical protein